MARDVFDILLFAILSMKYNVLKQIARNTGHRTAVNICSQFITMTYFINIIYNSYLHQL